MAQKKKKQMRKHKPKHVPAAPQVGVGVVAAAAVVPLTLFERLELVFWVVFVFKIHDSDHPFGLLFHMASKFAEANRFNRSNGFVLNLLYLPVFYCTLRFAFVVFCAVRHLFSTLPHFSLSNAVKALLCYAITGVLVVPWFVIAITHPGGELPSRLDVFRVILPFGVILWVLALSHPFPRPQGPASSYWGSWMTFTSWMNWINSARPGLPAMPAAEAVQPQIWRFRDQCQNVLSLTLLVSIVVELMGDQAFSFPTGPSQVPHIVSCSIIFVIFSCFLFETPFYAFVSGVWPHYRRLALFFFCFYLLMAILFVIVEAPLHAHYPVARNLHMSGLYAYLGSMRTAQRNCSISQQL